MSKNLVVMTWNGMQILGELVNDTEDWLQVKHMSSVIKNDDIESVLCPEPLPLELLGNDVGVLDHHINKKALLSYTIIPMDAELRVCEMHSAFWDGE